MTFNLTFLFAWRHARQKTVIPLERDKNNQPLQMEGNAI